MSHETTEVRNTVVPVPNSPRSWFSRLLSERSVQLAIVVWLIVNAVMLFVLQGNPPFNRPALEGDSYLDEIISTNVALVEVFLLMCVVYALTRARIRPNIAARAPAYPAALRETLIVIGYGVIGQLGGVVLGRLLGWHVFSFHLAGSLYGTNDVVSYTEVFSWASYNFTVYAVIPFLIFRRRYSAQSLNLTSTNRKNDLLVILAVLCIESLVQVAALSSTILDLNAREITLGVPLTFGLYFVGSVLPTMIFVYSILVPRYLKLTRSVPTTVILGGLTYTVMHFFDSWTLYTTPAKSLLSVAFLVMVYFGPGMIKTFLTLRTGNAWVHVWAYHAIAPHVIADTSLIVKIFQIK